MKKFTIKEIPVRKIIAVLENATLDNIFNNESVNNWVKNMTNGKSSLRFYYIRGLRQVDVQNSDEDLYIEFGCENTLLIIERTTDNQVVSL